MSALRLFVRQQFPEFGPDCYVEIKNPKLLPEKALIGARDARIGGDGLPDRDDQSQISNEMIAALIKHWHVVPAWDGETDPWEPEPLGEPSAHTVGQLPVQIKAWLGAQVVGALNPS